MRRSAVFAFMDRLPIERSDIFFFIGVSLLATGLGFVYWPLALIVPGIVFMVLGIAGGWVRAK